MKARRDEPGLRLAIDYAPLLIFLVVTFLVPDAPLMRLVAASTGALDDMDRLKSIVIARVLVATFAFMIATAVAMIVSRWKLGTISPMLWLSGGLVIVFGGLTLVFHDAQFIQMKPTFVYALLAAVLFFGLASGRPLLEQMLGATYPGLSALGWRKLTRNWALFFVAMALLNEVVRATFSFAFWGGYKLWGAIPLTLGFALANIPMMLRHGLVTDKGAVVKELPPEA